MPDSRLSLVVLLLAGLVAGSAAIADLSVEPSPVTVESRDEPVIISVMDGPASVAVNRIGSVRFRVGPHDYSHMVRVEPVGGKVRLSPTAAMEIGTYDLSLNINGRPITIPVQVTLEDEPTSLSSRASQQGLTEMDIRHQLGLYTEGRQSVSIDMPEWFYVGKRITFNMPTPAEASYEWYVNGALEKSGSGPHAFTYPLTTADQYDFRYVETSPRGAVIEARARTQAREEPPVEAEVARNRTVRLTGPSGYAAYTWLVGGEFQGEGRDFAYRFSEPGAYRVTCIATDNPSIADEAFRQVIFRVTVQ